MQLSAPAPASFSDVLLPVSPGDVSADASLAGEAPASDFNALFAGLTGAPAARAQTAGPAAPAGQPVSKTPMPSDESGVAALLAALIGVPESAPPPTPGNAAGEESAETNADETASADPTGLGLVVASPANAVVPATVSAAGTSARGHGTNLPTDSRGESARSLPGPGSASALPPSAGKAGPATAMPTAAAAAPADPVSLASAEAASPGESRRLAEGAPLAADPSLRGLKPGQDARTERAAAAFTKAAAKIAAEGLREVAPAARQNIAGEKNFLNIDGESLMKHEVSVGTGVALREPAMTTTAPATASPAIASVAVASRELGFDLGTPPNLNAKITVPEPVERLAHRAVEAVTETIERGASQTPHSVNLKFSVQGADLMVRVALRAEEVQVTFRTDSEDLRNALAHEWQAVRGRDGDGVLQSVTPVFTAGDSGHSTSQQQTGGRDQAATFAQLQSQADAQSQRQFSRQAPSAPAAPAAGASASPGAAAPLARPLSTDASGAARLLHTFA